MIRKNLEALGSVDLKPGKQRGLYFCNTVGDSIRKDKRCLNMLLWVYPSKDITYTDTNLAAHLIDAVPSIAG